MVIVLFQCNLKVCVFFVVFWFFFKQENYFTYLFKIKEPRFFGGLVGCSFHSSINSTLLISLFSLNWNETMKMDGEE